MYLFNLHVEADDASFRIKLVVITVLSGIKQSLQEQHIVEPAYH